MAAQASNSSSNANIVTVTVQTMFSGSFQVPFDRTKGEKELIRILQTEFPDEFPADKQLIVKFPERTEGNNGTNSSINKVAGDIRQVMNGDILYAMVADRVATLVGCDEGSRSRKGPLAYEFEVRRKGGVLIRSVRDLNNRLYSKKQILALIEQFPIQQLTVHYYPETKDHYYVMPHMEDIHYLEGVSPITKNKAHFAHYYAEKSFIPVQRNVNNNNNEWQDEEFELSEEFVNPTPEGQEMNVGVIEYMLTPEAIRDIREQIRKAQCTPADAEIMTHSFGGYRRVGVRDTKGTKVAKRKSQKKSKKAKKVGVCSHTARYTTGAKRKGASKKRKGSSKNKKKTMKRRLRR